MRESVPRQVDKESRVPKERGVWNSQGGRKDILFFFLISKFLILFSHTVVAKTPVTSKTMFLNRFLSSASRGTCAL